VVTFYCAVCLHLDPEEEIEARTIIDGNASCYDHLGYLAGRSLTAALDMWRRDFPAGGDQ
jgi:hypothetical protein